ncbi:YvrJ protein family protein [Halobacillus alkaliphilus]|uniref:YvrJ protein family protein n=1 Tax=Halobacillus alkaliphilus TaxID=396056 RepID=A0A1I2R7L3_9BACI|nr:YvrJ protein family protein [Halobacillus alkaliphilus]
MGALRSEGNVFLIRYSHTNCSYKRVIGGEVNGVETWLPFITDVGFPIAVTFYLLHRVEGKLDLLIETLHQLPEKIYSVK